MHSDEGDGGRKKERKKDYREKKSRPRSRTARDHMTFSLTQRMCRETLDVHPSALHRTSHLLNLQSVLNGPVFFLLSDSNHSFMSRKNKKLKYRNKK